MVENIPEGYKKTEVGVIPENWEVKRINDLVKSQIIEKPLDGNHGNIHPKSSDYVEYGIPFIMACNIENGILDLKNCKYIKKEQADKLQKGFSYVGDILITHKGTIGNVTVVENICSEYIMLTPQVTYYRVKDPCKLYSRYLFTFFQSNKFQEQMKALSGGGTRAYIGITTQLKLICVIPPLQEQIAIANALSDIDSLIFSLEKLIDKKKNIKQSAMQELLTGKKRLDGFKGDFKYVKLKSVCDVFMDGDWIEAKDQSTSGIRLIQTGNIGVGNFEYKHKHARYISQETFKRLNCKEVKKGDILVSRLPEPAGRSCIIPDIGVPMITSVDCTIIRFKPHYLANIFVNYTSTKKYNDDVSIMLSGSTRKRISRSSLGNILVPMFDIEEQIAIAQILSDMDTEIEKLNQKLDKYKEIKQGMMQELLTGKRRLI